MQTASPLTRRTGQIKTREDISYDFETKNSYWMTVEANDGQGGTASIVVIIKINDVKEPPSLPPSNFLVIPDDESLTVHLLMQCLMKKAGRQ